MIYLINTCNDCHLVIPKYKHYCIDCLRARRKVYHNRWLAKHPKYYEYHYNPAYNRQWYAKQCKLKEILLDDMIKHPRKYLDRVK